MATPSPLERELLALVDFPVEDLSTEIKDWLDLSQRPVRGDLARELIALGNHGGGCVLFGFSETLAGWPPSGRCPHDLRFYSQDEINNILKAHAEPVFECYVHHLASTSGTPHIVVRAPGGHIVPIRSRGAPAGSRLTDHTYFIRRPGPESAPPQNAREWDELITPLRDQQPRTSARELSADHQPTARRPEVAVSVAELATGATDPLTQWLQESLQRLAEVEGEDGDA